MSHSTAAQSVTPTVKITNPSTNTVFAAPARFILTADASAGETSVTNVEYFAEATSLGSASGAPFQVTGSIAAPGSYALTAIATASGVTGTSAVVNVKVIIPTAVSLSRPSVLTNAFSFQYIADPGLSYLIQTSSNLVDWVPVATNVATANPVLYSAGLASNAISFYRAALLTNP